MKKEVLTRILALALSLFVTSPGLAQKMEMLGLIGGVAVTSNPPELQKLTDKSHYVDGNGGLTYLYNNKVTDGYAFEWQLSFIGSTVKTLEPADNEKKVKFIVPLDFRWFLGNYKKVQAYLGWGLQYNSVLTITDGEDYENTYYDPWWGIYYNQTEHGENKRDWKLHQLSTNVAVGFKIPFGKTEIYDRMKRKDVKVKLHSLILGLKTHVPIINSSEHHGDDNSFVDLSKDKVNLSLTGGISFGFKKGNAIKIDAEYPLGGSNKYTINNGGHSTFLNTHSWSLSATLLFRI